MGCEWGAGMRMPEEPFQKEPGVTSSIFDRVPKELKECGALDHLPFMCSFS